MYMFYFIELSQGSNVKICSSFGTQTSSFNFISKLSIAELVYEVSKIDSPLINKDFTACTIVYVLPVPGIPRIRA
jgi:hypothetical protein